MPLRRRRRHCRGAARQRPSAGVTLVCHGPLSDSELALIDGTIDIILNHRLDDVCRRHAARHDGRRFAPPSEVISLPQPFDIITKENM
jgi:LacI family transcriptional regulator